MCVIAVCQTSRLSNTQVRRMWAANPFGVGVAWRADDDQGRSVVWEKGLSLKGALAANEGLPLPFIIHFRKPSIGTSMSAEGCHPFEIGIDASAALSGRTSNHVLFHNGYWNGWRDYIFGQSGHIPSGAWSDSRALAMRVFKRGFTFLQILDERVVCFGPQDIHVFGTWKILPHRDGDILISNNNWERDSVDCSGVLG